MMSTLLLSKYERLKKILSRFFPEKKSNKLQHFLTYFKDMNESILKEVLNENSVELIGIIKKNRILIQELKREQLESADLQQKHDALVTRKLALESFVSRILALLQQSSHIIVEQDNDKLTLEEKVKEKIKYYQECETSCDDEDFPLSDPVHTKQKFLAHQKTKRKKRKKPGRLSKRELGMISR
jgi:hypothetical protein